MNLSITLEQPGKKLALFGSADRNLRAVRDALGVQLVARDDELRISGETDPVIRAGRVIDALQQLLRRQDWVTTEEVNGAISKAGGSASVARTPVANAVAGSPPLPQPSGSDDVDVFSRGRGIRAKTAGQAAYLKAIFSHDLTICAGPAGTGKTYLAVAAAASMLKQGKAKRIVLTRPAVEAGERLGFLPGDLQAKVNPYLRPLFDALNDMMDFEQVKRFMVNDVIEVVPLAFMRGRTLNDSVIILDEAQNTTVSQMLMFLTRLGNEGKMIVTGDATQVDLPDGTPSGLADAITKLRGVPGVATVALDRTDIVRHKLVQDVVDAYERSARQEAERAASAPATWGPDRGDRTDRSRRGNGRPMPR